ncbi:MAG TPA: nitronate monooxygenase [Verrucomicrobiota bacterium]|nr:nitronate monooxygenase [Verrucomicrobiota bacterium]HNU51690.1 nitronate monooxygenase [Verrucomicrobiota bacterium]
MNHPQIIQGGMGVAVSGWPLARAVSQLGQLGVVSGTALAPVLARRLQLGDPGGELRHALSQFPFPHMAARVVDEYYVRGGKAADAPFKPVAMPTLHPPSTLVELTVVANFVEVFLAKEGHSGLVGINCLEKIQLPTLASLYGAMLAGVDCVLMGAGIPRAIPGALDRLAQGQPALLAVDVQGAAPGESYTITFDPQTFCGGQAPQLKRPLFLAIVAAATLAMTLARKASGRVDGFVVEGPTAGGHNAPPRGPLQLTPDGQPRYGPRDVPDLDSIRALGLPFWLAGGYGRPGRLAEALRLGAAGIQVGTPFAFCEESGIMPEIKRHAMALSRLGKARVFTDPLASPTGFPFKIAQMEKTLSETADFQARHRICDLGFLRHLYRQADGSVGYRCPAEALDHFLDKGGTTEQTAGRKCICNGLTATAALGQLRAQGAMELPLVTAGDDLVHLAQFLPPGRETYTAADVVRLLLHQVDGQRHHAGLPDQADAQVENVPPAGSPRSQPGPPSPPGPG